MEPHAGNVLEVQVPEDPTETPRRRGRRWVIAISVVVVAALLVGGGVALGRVTAPGPAVVVAAGPVVEASPEAEPIPVGLPPSPDPAESTPGPVVLVAANATGGPAVVMTAGDDLPDTSTQALGYRVTSEGVSPGQVAAVLANTLGATGTPVEASGTWTVGSQTGRRLVVQGDPLVSWEFTDAQATAQPATGPPMDADQAIGLAKNLLSSIGVDTETVDWQVDRYSGHTEVTAWQTVDRARTSLSWKVGLDPAGTIVSASGFSAGLRQVPGYPVVGARTAVNRTSMAGWSSLVPRLVSPGSSEPSPTPSPSGSPDATGAEPADTLPSDTFGTYAPSPLPSQVTTDSTGASTPPVPDPSPSSRPSLAVPVTTVTADSADLGVAQYWQPDGSLLILPAYVITASDGSRWSVLAIDGSYVDFVPTDPSPVSS